jgi:hypothetical protein
MLLSFLDKWEIHQLAILPTLNGMLSYLCRQLRTPYLSLFMVPTNVLQDVARLHPVCDKFSSERTMPRNSLLHQFLYYPQQTGLHSIHRNADIMYAGSIKKPQPAPPEWMLCLKKSFPHLDCNFKNSCNTLLLKGHACIILLLRTSSIERFAQETN